MTRIALKFAIVGAAFASSVTAPLGAVQTTAPQDATTSHMHPAWSPDGRWIAFVSRPARGGGQADLYLVSADGSEYRQLTDTPEWELQPSWSADGRQVFFQTGEPRQGWHLGVINVDGSGRRDVDVVNGNVARPSIAPGGDLMAVEVGRGDSIVIYTARIDGSRARALTSSQGAHPMPSWSPDGTQLLYSYRPSRAEHWQLFVMNRDGSRRTQLTVEGADDGSFSPDGARIVFGSDRSGTRYEVWIMNADGTGQRSLTAQIDGSASGPSFSPDGSRIVFSVVAGGRSSLYVMGADGSGIHPLSGSR